MNEWNETAADLNALTRGDFSLICIAELISMIVSLYLLATDCTYEHIDTRAHTTVKYT